MRHTIDDAIALLLQIEPGDRAALRDLQAMAAELAADATIGDDARALLAAAAQSAGRGALD
ncbi:MAG: hypothetical protein KGO03_10600, partial [Gemmatimonadota bacterium]|nr:hypothetical protein [Gemmatimonadota bacterium]